MLCYLPSRNVTDVVRDTFYWFTLNRRASRLMLSIITVLSVVTAIIFYKSTPIKFLSAQNYDLFTLLRPYSYVSPYVDRSNNTAVIYGYVFLTFVSTFLIVPLLHRYFLGQKSLTRLTYTKYLDAIKKHIGNALISAFIWAAVCYGVISANWFFSLVFVFAGSILAAMDFCGWRSFKKIYHFWFYVRSIFTAMILFCFIQAAPMLCSELIGIALYFLDDLLPNALSTDSLSTAIDMIASVIMCISYCMAVIFFNTIVILIYGSSVDIE